MDVQLIRLCVFVAVLPVYLSAMYQRLPSHVRLTKTEKREYKAIRAAVLAQDAAFAEKFNEKYPHIICSQSIQELVYYPSCILSHTYGEHDLSVFIADSQYHISGGLADKVRKNNPRLIY